MTSPAQQHRTRVLAARASAADGDAPAVMGGIYGQMMAKLTQDRRRLHDIQSVERKVAVKRELVPEYADYLQGVLAGDGGQPDEAVTTLMVWHFDIGAFAPGLQLADYVLRHDLQLPERLAQHGHPAAGRGGRPGRQRRSVQARGGHAGAAGSRAPGGRPGRRTKPAPSCTWPWARRWRPRPRSARRAAGNGAGQRRTTAPRRGAAQRRRREKLIEQLDRKIKNAGDAG